MLGRNSKILKTVQAKVGKLQTRNWHPPSKNYDPQFGDYPQLPWTPFSQRDPKLKWDDPVHRRMFGEPIHEEFDLQDAYFTGDHDPAGNLWNGLKGQLMLHTWSVTLLGLAFFTFNADTKPAPREIPDSVIDHYRTFNAVSSHRPYDSPAAPCNLELVVADCGHVIYPQDNHH